MKRFLHSLASRGLPRLLADGARLAGLLLLTFAALLPWFRVPSDVPLGDAVRGIEPGVTWLFRGLCVAVVLASVAAGFRGRHGGRIAGGLFVALLLYPTAVLHTAPGTAARAAWLWHQHDELTGYAGDVYISQEVRDATWQQRIRVVNEPIENRILKLPTWSSANLEWGRFFEITEWLGLSAWFSQGLARGWVLAVGGATLLLLACGRERAMAEPGFIRRSVRPASCVAALVLIAVTIPFFACAQFLSHARDLVRSGEYEAALTALHRAGLVLPAAREDGSFFLQIGRLEAELNRATPAAEYFHARRLAEDGFTQQAQAAMVAALQEAQPGSVWHRELVRSLVARAISELNSGQSSPATDLLHTVIAADPCNLKANYVLQIACVRAGRTDELRVLAARMKDTYRFLNTPTKRSVLASAQEHVAFSELQSGALALALTHWRHSKRLPK